MAGILPAAQKQGYEPDSLVCPEDVPAGRPQPWMLYRSAMDLEVYPMSACVKVGDTVVDIEEGLNAGAWTIGLARSGSELGLSQEEAQALDPQELATRLEGIYDRMYRAGAHYVVDTIAEVPSVLDEIEPRLKRGEQP
jgi:phosphonoacetaldehyde hydrolase